eukprot:2553844-Pleurochrysis_carterae.AAC.1
MKICATALAHFFAQKQIASAIQGQLPRFGQKRKAKRLQGASSPVHARPRIAVKGGVASDVVRVRIVQQLRAQNKSG